MLHVGFKNINTMFMIPKRGGDADDRRVTRKSQREESGRREAQMERVVLAKTNNLIVELEETLHKRKEIIFGDGLVASSEDEGTGTAGEVASALGGSSGVSRHMSRKMTDELIRGGTSAKDLTAEEVIELMRKEMPALPNKEEFDLIEPVVIFAVPVRAPSSRGRSREARGSPRGFEAEPETAGEDVFYAKEVAQTRVEEDQWTRKFIEESVISTISYYVELGDI